MVRILLGASLGSLRKRVRALLGAEPCRDVDILASTDLAEDLRGIAIVVLGVAHLRGHSAGAVAEYLRRINPSITIYVVAETLHDLAPSVRGIARQGVDEAFVLQHSSEAVDFAERIRRRLLAPAPARVMDWIHGNLPRTPGYRVLSWTLLNAYLRPSTVGAAIAFGMDRNTVRRHLEEAGYPGFREVGRIGLLVHVMELRARSGCSSAEAAKRLGFRDGSELSQIKREFHEKARGGSLWSLPLPYEA